MPPSCFAAGSPSLAPASAATSVYWTHVGTIALTWSRAALGLLLAAELDLRGDNATAARFDLRPWLPWRRCGSKRFFAAGRLVAFSWDLSRARLAGRRPEPVSRYSLSVYVDGELALAAGDLAAPAAAGRLLSRREHATGAGSYTTTVVVAGEPHEVAVGVEDAAMWVAVDGEKALQVRRLRWKFRGSEKLDLPRGRLAVSWDLHGWLFTPDAAAVFVLQFETDTDQPKPEEAETPETVGGRSSWKHQLGPYDDRESCSSSPSEKKAWRWGLFKSGSDTSVSVSVASSVDSSAGSVSTVADWASAEAAALKDGDGFSLVVYLWKKRR